MQICWHSVPAILWTSTLDLTEAKMPAQNADLYGGLTLK